LNLSAATSGVLVNLSTGVVTLGPTATDTISGITGVVGSPAGGTTFVVGTGSATLSDPGSVGGDTISFADVVTSPSTPLTVNVSGIQVGTTPTDTATVGSATYTFTSGGSDFTNFVGPSTGSTTFVVGSTGGLSLQALGPDNTLNLSAATAGVVITLTNDSVDSPGVVTGLSPGPDGSPSDQFADIAAFIGSYTGIPLPPTASISTPANGQTFALGQVVSTNFTCTDGAYGPGIATCIDSNGSRSPGVLSTATPGTYTYNVTATSSDGQIDVASITYNVASASQLTQVINFEAPPTSVTIAETPINIPAAASSGLPVTFSATTAVCSASGTSGVVTLLKAGTCTVKLSQAGDATYSAAPTVVLSFTVTQLTQVINFYDPGSATMAQTSVMVAASASSGLAVSFTTTTPAVCTASGTSGVVTLLKAGTCTVKASQAGNAIYSAAAPILDSFTVSAI
jgi:hypothetical protein